MTVKPTCAKSLLRKIFDEQKKISKLSFFCIFSLFMFAFKLVPVFLPFHCILHSFFYSFIRLFIHSSIHLFTPLFVNVCVILHSSPRRLREREKERERRDSSAHNCRSSHLFIRIRDSIHLRFMHEFHRATIFLRGSWFGLPIPSLTIVTAAT